MPQWTDEQKQVIDARNCNILVSAAAGSGKTAVLVERIFKLITDRKRKVNIDELLVVTFTRAAAGEMKERLLMKLEEALEKDPGNAHIAGQITRIHNANICTIDSFCLSVVQSHFHEIDLDPAFRTGDEGELKLLKKDVVEGLLEEEYEKETPAFLLLVRGVETGRRRTAVGELIQGLFEYAQSHPDPENWLLQAAALYETSMESVFDELCYRIVLELRSLSDMEDRLISMSAKPGAPDKYSDFFCEEKARLEAIAGRAEKCDYEGIRGILSDEESPFKRMPAVRKGQDHDPALKERIEKYRKGVKESYDEIKKTYFYASSERIRQDLSRSGEMIGELVRLTILFSRRFGEAKRSKNLVDYSDMEHMALDILCPRVEEAGGDGSILRRPSGAAREYRHLFKEVMVDEYQDSNELQEAILTAVSGEEDGIHNRFMVGDVKQSIYSFRQARPDMFIEKYLSYGKDAGADCRRIDLHKNFRSREIVLDSANSVFAQIMRKEIGNVVYDEEQALVFGNMDMKVEPAVLSEEPAAGTSAFENQDAWTPAFENSDAGILAFENQDMKTPRGDFSEVLLMETGKDSLYEGDDSKVQLEARMIGDRILELMKTQQVLDKDAGGARGLQYGDVAILVRSSTNWAETLAEELHNLGIPSVSQSKTGYWDALEVMTVLNYLRILDNPFQDIPLAAVLHSPIGGFSSQELAEIRTTNMDVPFYRAVTKAVESDSTKAHPGELHWSALPEKTREKLADFFRILQEHRQAMEFLPLDKLIVGALKSTGYDAYLAALPDGKKCIANIDMLIQKARDYEKTSYKGLFHFLRYLDQLKAQDVDYGEANVESGESGCVRIMTIHKSKGLEFPVVFLAGLGSQCKRSNRDVLVLHQKYGVAMDAIYPEEGFKRCTIYKDLINQETELDSLGEELRVLYVAMTRARDHLILTGSAANVEEKLVDWREQFREGDRLSYDSIRKSKTYLDLLMPAILDTENLFVIREYTGRILSDRAIFRKTKRCITREVLERMAGSGEDLVCLGEGLAGDGPEKAVYHAGIRKRLGESRSYVYPYGSAVSREAKISVSDVKLKHFQESLEDGDDGESLFEAEVPVPLIPDFMKDQEEGAVKGTRRGIAYHRFLELWNYETPVSVELDRLVEEKRMTPEDRGLIYPRHLEAFLESDIGRRMRAAFLAGTLRREQMFMLGISEDGEPCLGEVTLEDGEPCLGEVTSEDGEPCLGEVTSEDGDLYLMQGVIDAYFAEGEDLVVVDYKTDRVGSPEELIDRYRIQLDYYALALTQMTGKRVKEKVIYSFALNRGIVLPVGGPI